MHLQEVSEKKSVSSRYDDITYVKSIHHIMGSFKKILVPLDGSANSMSGLDKAIDIAKASDV